MNLTNQQKQIIIALAEDDLRPSRVAKHLFMHRNTVIYHMNAIKTKTGLDPKKFYDLIKLLEEYT